MIKSQTKYKQTEIGEIPSDWNLGPLDQFVSINPQRSLKKGEVGKYVPMANLQPFQRKISGYETKTFNGGTKFINSDTLLARITPCLENGKTAYVDILENGEVGFGSTEYIVLNKKNTLSESKFVYYLSLSPRFRDIAIKSMVGSSGRQRVQTDKLANSIFAFPKLKEQRQIASILSSLDDKIELNRQINKTLEEIGKTLFKRWFVDFEFPNNEGKPYKSSGGKMEDSELGKIPEGWKVKKLGSILLEIETGKRPRGGVNQYSDGIPSIGAENINGLANYDYSKEKYIPHDFFERLNRGVLRHKDVLLYKDGAQIGKKTVYRNDFPHKKCCVNEHVFILRTYDNLQNYLYFWLDLPAITQEIINLNSNAAQPGINQVSVKSLIILVPNEKILNIFDSVVEKLLDRIYENARQNHLLSKIRDYLLPRLMSGKLRVS